MRRRAWGTLLITVVVFLAAFVSGCTRAADRVTYPTASAPLLTQASASASAAAPVSPGSRSVAAPASSARVTIATGLTVPWGLAFLPGGAALVTLRDRGEVLYVAEGAKPVSVGRVPGVQPDGEGGLLGIAVSPTFASDRAVFAYLTSADDNRVLRMTFEANTLRAGPVIVKGIARAGNHNGGRLAFGPDGYLYISTGDAGQGDAAQDKTSLNGKILRVTNQGVPAPGNPFPGSRIWSLGHRNVQGLAWDKAGKMYASEFGQNTWDELNHIEPGRNYGWPVVEGKGRRPGFTDPLQQWPTADASPSGIAVGADGAVYLAALRGESLWRIPVNGNGEADTPQRLVQGTYGRLRTVVSAPDGRLWLVTSNTFRGTPNPGDDRILALRLPVQQ